MLENVASSLKSYESVYQRLIKGFELEAVTSFFLMEEIAENRPLPMVVRS